MATPAARPARTLPLTVNWWWKSASAATSLIITSIISNLNSRQKSASTATGSGSPRSC